MSPRWLSGLLVLLCALAAVELRAQGERPAGLDVDAVTARLDAAKENANLAEGEKGAAVESYTKALEALRAGDAAAGKAAALLAFRESVDGQLREAKQALAAEAPPRPPTPAEGATLADLERAAAGADEAQKGAQRQLEAAEERLRSRAQRQPMLPQLIATARERLATAEAQLAAFAPPEAPTAASDARRVELQARRYAAAQALRELEAELQSYEGSEEMLTAQRDLAQRRAVRATEQARGWQALVQARRKQEAEAAAADAAGDVAAAEDRHPLLVELAQQNEVFARRRADVARQLADVAKAQERAERRRDSVDQDLQDLTKRVEAVGNINDTLGALLRDRRSSLPDARAVRTRLADTRALRRTLQLEKFELDDERRLLLAPDNLERVVAGAEPPVEDADLETVREAARLLEARLELVEQLRKDSNALFEALIRVEEAELALLGKVERFVEFVNELVLWAPSSQPIWRAGFEGGRGGLQWLLSPRSWTKVVEVLWGDLRENPAESLLVVAVALLLFLLKRRVHRLLVEQGELASRGSSVEFLPTVWALALTLLAAAPLPATLWGVGWRLDQNTDPSDFARAVAVALEACAWLLLALEFFRHVVRADGLAEAHFAWPPTALRPLRRGLLVVTPVLVAGAAALVMLEHSGSISWKEGLGRPVLLLMLIVLAVFFWRTLHPRTGIASMTRRGAQVEGWSSRMRRVWFLLGVGIPAALIVLDVLGYHFTAVQLVLRLGASAGVVAALFLVNDVILRGLVLERRRLALRRAAERRKAAAQKAAEGDAAPAAATVEEPLVDVSSIAEQTRRLLRSLLTLALVLGAWIIWVDVLPALGVFRDVTLWEEITLADAMLSAIVFVMTFLASRNIPGVLHITLLQRLDMHEGERHAIATIARYVIILIGVITGFSTLGLGWGKVQWLAAGVSVGLGFGLQEVFANFVSGLIILLERPIRVGDLVTVAGIDGYVTRIQMRATTIRDYNRKELVIPNKEFITGSVVNWTLSDAVTRLIVGVGIAYGSDTALAKELLLQVAREEPQVLDKPKPKALFLRFGESSLDFELRVFTANVDVWPEVIDTLHRRIDDAFRAAGIEIAFPQRDLHIRTAGPLVEALRRGDDDDGER